MFCEKCGAKLKKGTSCCHRCGAQAPVSAAADGGGPLHAKGGVNVLAIIIPVLGMLMLALLVLLMLMITGTLRVGDTSPVQTIMPGSAVGANLEEEPEKSYDFTACEGCWYWEREDNGQLAYIEIGSDGGRPTIPAFYYTDGTDYVTTQRIYAVTAADKDTVTFKFEDNFGGKGEITARYDEKTYSLRLECDGDSYLAYACVNGFFTYYAEDGAENSRVEIYNMEESIRGRILPDASFRLYSEEEVMERIQPWLDYGYSLEEVLRFARNECFATYGNLFKDEELNDYFYVQRGDIFAINPTIDSAKAYDMMNEYEKKNIELIQAMEEKYR